MADSLSGLGVLYHDQGRHEESGPLFERALAIHKQALGTYNSAVSADLNNLAQHYHATGPIRRGRAAVP